MEDVARERIAGGDDRLTLVCGDGLFEAEHLPDGIHPGDEGHRILAAAFGVPVRAALEESDA
jgi:hypothetical protein